MTRDLLLKYMAPFIEQGTDAQHYSVLAVFLLAAWTGLWGAFQLEEGFEATSMFPEGSYITDSYRLPPLRAIIIATNPCLPACLPTYLFPIRNDESTGVCHTIPIIDEPPP